MNNNQNVIKINSKQFWTFFKHKIIINDVHNFIRFGDISANIGQDIINLFGKYFSSISLLHNNLSLKTSNIIKH